MKTDIQIFSRVVILVFIIFLIFVYPDIADLYINDINRTTAKIVLLEPEINPKLDTTKPISKVSEITTDEVIGSILLGLLIAYCVLITVQLLSDN